MRCPNCGAQNRPGLRFCEQCAAPLVGTRLEAAQICPRCGARNRPGLRFCEQCATPLITPRGGVAAPRRRRRWPLWAGAAASILLLIACLGAVLLIYFRFARPDRDQAVGVADRIVQQSYPEYIGAQRSVNDWGWENGKMGYAVSYRIEANEAGGRPFPRALIIYLNPDTHKVRIEEMN